MYAPPSDSNAHSLNLQLIFLSAWVSPTRDLLRPSSQFERLSYCMMFRPFSPGLKRREGGKTNLGRFNCQHDLLGQAWRANCFVARRRVTMRAHLAVLTVQRQFQKDLAREGGRPAKTNWQSASFALTQGISMPVLKGLPFCERNQGERRAGEAKPEQNSVFCCVFCAVGLGILGFGAPHLQEHLSNTALRCLATDP